MELLIFVFRGAVGYAVCSAAHPALNFAKQEIRNVHDRLAAVEQALKGPKI